jgi:hypothetical protein
VPGQRLLQAAVGVAAGAGMTLVKLMLTSSS